MQSVEQIVPGLCAGNTRETTGKETSERWQRIRVEDKVNNTPVQWIGLVQCVGGGFSSQMSNFSLVCHSSTKMSRELLH